MTPNGLPGICRGCGNPVVYTSRHWRNPSHLGRHVCPPERPTCGAWMPIAKERCARRPGHVATANGHGHRSRYVMDNDLAMRTGHRKAHTPRDGVSVTPNV